MSMEDAKDKSLIEGFLDNIFGSMKLGKKLAYGFGFVLLLLVVITVMSLYRMSIIHENLNHIVNDYHRKVIVANGIVDQFNRVYQSMRNIALSKDMAFTHRENEKISIARKTYAQGMEELKKTVVTAEGKAYLAEIEKLISELRPVNDTFMQSIESEAPEEISAVLANQLEPGQDKLLQTVTNLIHFQERLMSESVSEAEKSYWFAFVFSIALGIISFLLATMVAWALNMGITKPINRVIDLLTQSADQVSNAASEVAASSRQLAEGAQAQASSIEETSASLEEMSSMTKTNADNAAQANEVIEGTKRDVEKADKIMKSFIESMNEIARASEDTEKIVRTIDEIAFQTNLLALNAAVEAARAGEAGAGFAVVADEVRNLAMRSAQAAKNTEELIQETVQKIQNGRTLLEQTKDAFGQVATDSDKIGQFVESIASAARERAAGIAQVNLAVSDIEKIVQQNAAGAEQSASASESMLGQSEQLKEQVKKLMVLIGGQQGGQELPC